MKVLMFTSKEPNFYMGLSCGEKRFPIGVGYLISVLKRAGHEIDFVDRYLLGDVWNGHKNYDFIGIYSNTPCFQDTKNIIKKMAGKGKLMVGGPHTSIFPKSVPEEVDFICQGEGELAILDIVEGKQKERLVKKDRIEDLDALPPPPFDLFSRLPYHNRVPWFPESPVFNMCTSRGCSFNCSFCSVGDIWGKRVTMMSAGRIIEDIEKCVKDFGIKGVYFREDNFTISKSRVRKFCELLLRKLVNIKWCCETRVDTVDRDLLLLMSRAGCKALYVGFESGSDKMLKIYNKGTTTEQNRKLADWTKEASIDIAASMIFGHPQETDEDRAMSEKFLRDIKPKTIWMNRYRSAYELP